MSKTRTGILLLSFFYFIIITSYLYSSDKVENKNYENDENYKIEDDYNYQKNSLYLLIDKNLKISRYYSVKKMLDNFVEKNPGHQERKIYYYYAVVYEELKNNTQAIINYQKAVSICPKYSLALNGLAGLFFKLGRYEESEDLFIKALEANPYNPFFNFNLGNFYLITGNFNSAEKYFSNACNYKTNYGAAFSKLGYVLFISKKYFQSIECYNKAIKYNCTSYETYYYLGLAHKNYGQAEKAIENFKNSIKVKNNFFDGFFELGNIYQLISQYNPAIKYYLMAEAINPDNTNAKIRVSECYYALKRYDDAINALERVVKLEPGNKRAVELRAKIKEKMNSAL